MQKSRFAAVLGWCVVTMLGAGPPEARAQNVVTDWSLEAQNVITAGRPPASSEYLLALVHAAMYDAAVAVDGRYKPFGVKARVQGQTSIDAAIAAAAYHVLRQRVPASEPALTTRYLAYVAALPQGSPRDSGEQLGAAVAAEWIARRADDRFDVAVPYVQPTPGPGVFEPVAASEPVDVKLRHVRPFVIGVASRFRPQGPPPLRTKTYAKAFDEVAAYGRSDSVTRTPDQLEAARFWAEHAATQWNRNLRRIAISESLPTVETARMMAMAHVASADAAIGCFEAKYTFLFWRPVHAIRRADTDDNPLTTFDPTWAALLTVNHPEYPSAHSCWTGALTSTLASFFGGDERAIALDSTFTGTTHHYERFSDIAREVGDARVFGGIHFRFSIDDGLRLGRKVAEMVTWNHFQSAGRGEK
jgi:hypothetical protein